MKRKPCGRAIPAKYPNPGDCPYERAKGLQRCVWHWLLAQPADVQAKYAKSRLSRAEQAHDLGQEFRARVPAEEWPPGERWCAGCQSFVPLFYTTGSRCKACASVAAHSARVEKVYGISSDDYQRILRAQGGRCFICRRHPGKKRLAVDHNHKTGEVRGLLCASNENGCNRGVVAILEQAADGGLEAAKRAVAYFEDPPWARVQRGERVLLPEQPVIKASEPLPPF